MKRKASKKARADKPTPSGRLFPEQAPDGYAYVQAHYRRKTSKRKTGSKRKR